MCGDMFAQRNNSASGLAVDGMLRAQGYLGEVLLRGW
jgi:hypothetical protein